MNRKTRVVHVIGNGPSSFLYNEDVRKGLKLSCNSAPFHVEGLWASCVVDMKYTNNIKAGLVTPQADQWILGHRPKKLLENPKYVHFRHRVSNFIKEYYLDLPEYAGKGEAGYKNLSCGHFAVHYACNRLSADVVHMYGFDSLFEYTANSCTDMNMQETRNPVVDKEIVPVWRRLWNDMFNDFSETKFNLHYKNNKLKIDNRENLNIIVY